MGVIAYLTDVEGRLDKLEAFVEGNPHVTFDGTRLALSDGVTFVFGGDAIDRGPNGRRLVALLLDAKRRFGERVVLLAGNRDLNKLRLRRELSGAPPAATPPAVAAARGAELLRWIFQYTMGAGKAFELRREELVAEGGSGHDEEVVESFLADLGPDGPLTAYLAHCQLAYRHGETLFVHGAVTEGSLGFVPGLERRIGEVDRWIEALNAFHRDQVEAYREDRRGPDGLPGWEALVAYQAPLPGKRENPSSVVYARTTDACLNPLLPSRALEARLRDQAITRVVVGHTPTGDSPSLLEDDGFQVVFADNSRGRTELGSRVFVDGPRLLLEGRVVLDDGCTTSVTWTAEAPGQSGAVGRRDADSGRLLKGRLGAGQWLGFRFLPGYEVEQRALSDDDVVAARWVAPR